MSHENTPSSSASPKAMERQNLEAYSRGKITKFLPWNFTLILLLINIRSRVWGWKCFWPHPVQTISCFCHLTRLVLPAHLILRWRQGLHHTSASIQKTPPMVISCPFLQEQMQLCSIVRAISKTFSVRYLGKEKKKRKQSK